MKRAAFPSVAVWAMLLSPAFAAELPLKAPPLQAAPVTNWSGCYVGGAAGVVWAHGDPYTTTGSTTFFQIPPGVTTNVPGGQVASGPFDMSGGLAGVFGGCNYQTGAWVIGAEADWSALNAKGSASSSTAGLNSPLGPIVFTATNWTQTQHDLVTARARLGYAYGANLLLYATGGAAWTKVDSSLSQPGTLFSEMQSNNVTGWTIGAGAEYMLPFQGWILRTEYLHVEFPAFTTFSPPITSAQPGAVNGFLTNVSTKVTDNILRVGLSYKFGNWAQR